MHKAAYKIMILTSRFGEGHWMVTQALKGHGAAWHAGYCCGFDG